MRQLGPIAYTAGDPFGVCKGWISFSGRGTGTILDSYNVGSLTRNGAGDYTITWSPAFADANYALAGISMTPSINDAYVFTKGTPTASSVNVICRNAGTTQQDTDIITVAVWGLPNSGRWRPRLTRQLGAIGREAQLAQALVNWWITLNESTATILDSYNVASITNNGTGDFTITFAPAFAATAYAMMGVSQSDTVGQGSRVSIKLDTMPTTTSMRITTWNPSLPAAGNSPRACVAGIGLGGSVGPSQENQVSTWVQFDASSGTPTIKGSYNVAFLTDVGAGDATVNFLTPYANANYCVLGFAGNTTDASAVGYYLCVKASTTPTTSSVEVISSLGNQLAGADITQNNVLILGHY